MTELPESVTLTLCLHLDWSDYSRIVPFITDMTKYGYTYLGDATVTVSVPQVDYRQKMVESLRDEKKKVHAEATQKMKKLEEKIQSLLALEHKAEV